MRFLWRNDSFFSGFSESFFRHELLVWYSLVSGVSSIISFLLLLFPLVFSCFLFSFYQQHHSRLKASYKVNSFCYHRTHFIIIRNIDNRNFTHSLCSYPNISSKIISVVAYFIVLRRQQQQQQHHHLYSLYRSRNSHHRSEDQQQHHHRSQ